MLGRHALSAGAVLVAAPALASGGAHVVDDSAIETPGKCHVDSWATHESRGAGFANFGPACTRTAMPFLELGTALGQGIGGGTTTAGIAPKLRLRSEERGVGFGASGAAGYDFRRGRVETAAAIGLVTLPSRAGIRVNANLGWVWTRTGNVHALFAGAQAEIAVAPHFGVMVEGFGRSYGKAGAQAGIRWMPRDALTVDLLAARYLDGVTPTALTFGVTLHH